MPRSVSFSDAVSRAHAESTSAAAPDTCGAAIDVPLEAIGAADRRRRDVHARCGKVDGPRPAVRKRGQLVVAVGRRHGEDIGHEVIGGVHRRDVVVRAAVAGRNDEQHVTRVGEAISSLSSAWENSRRPSCSRALGRSHRSCRRMRPWCCDQELDRLDGVVGEAAGIGVEELGADQARDPVHTGHADAVVAGGADGARYVGAVIVIVLRVAGVGDRVEAVRPGGAGDGRPAHDDTVKGAGADHTLAARSGCL